MTDHVAGARHPPPSDDLGPNSDDDGPAKKRLRVSRACDPCRRRKERCDGSQPTCQRCNKVGRSCSYIPYRKRGLRTGYVRAIEIILGLLIHSRAGAEDLILTILRYKTNQPPSSHDLALTSAPHATSLLESWRKSKAHEDLQRALMSSDEDEDEEMYLQNLDDKLTSTFNLLTRHSHHEDFHESPESAGIDTHLADPVLPVAAPSPQRPIQTITHGGPPLDVALSQSSLPPNWSQLIEVYLSNTHSWLPVIQKYTLYRSASLLSCAGGTSHGTKPSSGELCSLWAVLAYSAHQLEDVNPPVDPSGAPIPTDIRPSALLHTLAKRLVTQPESQYEVGHVHALLILTLSEISQRAWLDAWLWVGRAVYISASLGIIPVRPGQTNKDSEDSRKRLALGCFVLDTLVATKLGLRPYLRQTDLIDIGSLTSDGIEEWEIWRPMAQPSIEASFSPPGPGRVLSTFNHLCYIAGVLNSMSGSATDAGSRTTLLQYLQRLGEWNNENPLHGCLSVFKEQSKESFVAPHSLQLRLAAAATYVLLSKQNNAQEGISPGARLPGNLTQESLEEPRRFLSDLTNTTKIRDSTRFFPAAGIFLDVLQCNTEPNNDPSSSSMSNPLVEQLRISPQSEAVVGNATDRVPPSASIVPANQTLNMNDLAALQTRGISSQQVGTGYSPKTVQQLPPAGVPPFTHPRSLPKSSSEPSHFMNPLGVVPTPPRSIQSTDHVQATTSAMESQHTMPNIPLSEASDQNGLFNQLSLLGRADWPVFSEDFMEHLGLSRDGSLMDYQNLFAPP